MKSRSSKFGFIQVAVPGGGTMEQDENRRKSQASSKKGGRLAVPPPKRNPSSLLQFPETSPRKLPFCAPWRTASRDGGSNNEGIVLGQIGIEIAPLSGQVQVCSFGEGHTTFESNVMSDEERPSHAADNFTAVPGNLCSLLMTMHTFDFERLSSHRADGARAYSARKPDCVNIGDFGQDQARDLKAAGVNEPTMSAVFGRERIPRSPPEQRKATIRCIKDAGLDWYYCCEPIGPEHTPQELADQIFRRVGIRVLPTCRNAASVYSIGSPGRSRPDFGTPTCPGNGPWSLCQPWLALRRKASLFTNPICSGSQEERTRSTRKPGANRGTRKRTPRASWTRHQGLQADALRGRIWRSSGPRRGTERPGRYLSANNVFQRVQARTDSQLQVLRSPPAIRERNGDVQGRIHRFAELHIRQHGGHHHGHKPHRWAGVSRDALRVAVHQEHHRMDALDLAST